MIIATVLRSGGGYTPAHVQWLHRQLPPDVPSVCFSDVDVPDVQTIPLQHDWPGWWSKMELFRPDIMDDIFFIDLDTVIVGDITELLSEKRLAVLSDFYHPATIGSAIMRIPHSVKAGVWDAFVSDVDHIMHSCTVPGKKWGDQGFLMDALPASVRWQKEYPGQIVSYKQHIAKAGMPGWHNIRSTGNGCIPSDTRIVCFHGKPRPWEVSLPWVPPLSAY